LELFEIPKNLIDEETKYALLMLVKKGKPLKDTIDQIRLKVPAKDFDSL